VELLLIGGAVLALLFLAKKGDAGSAPPVGSGGASDSDNPDYGSFDDIVEGWSEIEGFYKPGTLAQRLNNPVNIHGTWPGVTGHTSSGEAIFDNVDDGWDAAVTWLEEQEQQHPNWNFLQLFAKVLGNLQGNPVDNAQGNSNDEANYVANYLGVPAGTVVTDYTGDES
jgi:hypothetical protein